MADIKELLSEKHLGLPTWGWIAAGGALVVFVWWRNRNSSASTSTASTQAPGQPLNFTVTPTDGGGSGGGTVAAPPALPPLQPPQTPSPFSTLNAADWTALGQWITVQNQTGQSPVPNPGAIAYLKSTGADAPGWGAPGYGGASNGMPGFDPVAYQAAATAQGSSPQ